MGISLFEAEAQLGGFRHTTFEVNFFEIPRNVVNEYPVSDANFPDAPDNKTVADGWDGRVRQQREFKLLILIFQSPKCK